MTFSVKEKQGAAGVTINYGPVVHGDNAQIASAQDSPEANVASAQSGGNVNQTLRNAVEDARRRDAELGKALQALEQAILKSADLVPAAKTSAAEELAFVAQQCALPPASRQPRSVTKVVLAGLRETLALGADVLEVWNVFGPIIVAALGAHF